MMPFKYPIPDGFRAVTRDGRKMDRIETFVHPYYSIKVVVGVDTYLTNFAGSFWFNGNAHNYDLFLEPIPTLSNFCVKCESVEQIRPVVEWMNEQIKPHYYHGHRIGHYYGNINGCTLSSSTPPDTTPIITVEEFIQLRDAAKEEQEQKFMKVLNKTTTNGFSQTPTSLAEFNRSEAITTAFNALFQIGDSELCEVMKAKYAELRPPVDLKEEVVRCAVAWTDMYCSEGDGYAHQSRIRQNLAKAVDAYKKSLTDKQ